MNQDDLSNKSISQMTDEELHAYMKELRSNRRKQPEKPAKKQTKKSSGDSGKKKKDDMQEMLKNLSPEEKEKLLKDLGGE